MGIGAAGEAFAAATPDVPGAVQLIGGGINTLLSVAMFVAAVVAIVVVIQGRRERNSPAAQPTTRAD